MVRFQQRRDHQDILEVDGRGQSERQHQQDGWETQEHSHPQPEIHERNKERKEREDRRKRVIAGYIRWRREDQHHPSLVIVNSHHPRESVELRRRLRPDMHAFQ